MKRTKDLVREMSEKHAEIMQDPKARAEYELYLKACDMREGSVYKVDGEFYISHVGPLGHLTMKPLNRNVDIITPAEAIDRGELCFVMGEIDDIELGGVDTRDYPDFCDAHIEYATFMGRELEQDELDVLTDLMSDEIGQMAYESLI